MTTEALESLRHSLAHLLAAAVLTLRPDAKPTIGPAVENGFYYDFQFSEPVSESDLPKIEKEMKRILKSWKSFERIETTYEEAKDRFKNNPFKLEIISELEAKNDQITLYQSGDFIDLCRGGHVESAKEMDSDAFKLTKVAGAYWRGDETKPQLTRIYGVAFETKENLEEYLHLLEEAKKRDHKKLGVELDLFTFSELVGSGLPLWTPKGTLLRNTLDNLVWKLRKAHGYEQVDIPHITKKDLYETSGHWEKFKNELFRITTREGHEFAMKPMNCPHHTQIYARRQWSYRELPQRYASTTKVYRDEQTGELSGLSRVRAITQDDAHVFCRPSQVKEEISKVWEIIHEFYGAAGFTLSIRLSLHDPKVFENYLGTPDMWEKAENELREILKEKSAEAIEAVGEAAFYGPKIDFIAKDSLGREWQVATIQLDMNQPERFDLFCINEEGAREQVVMIHAAIMGSIERYLSILIEHFAGAFPFWLAPVQIALLPINDKNKAYIESVAEELKKKNVRFEIDWRNESIGKKIREAEMQKVPYLFVIGDKEVEANTVAVRERSKGDTGAVELAQFLKSLHETV